MSPRVGSIVVALALAGCQIDGQTESQRPTGEAGDRSSRCAGGDRAAGEQLVAELRRARLDQSADLASARATLGEACEAGCGVTCLELARSSFVADEVTRWHRKACDLGEPRGCQLSSTLDLATAGELCDAGEMFGCAGLLRLAADEQRVVDAAARGCASDDGRACSVHAWIRCGLGPCDATAIESAQKAARLLPEPEVVETLALVLCHAGQPEQADQQLASACAAGIQDACERRCESLLGTSLLVREPRRASYERIATLLLLQLDARASWYSTLSAMDEAELDGFQAILESFTPPISEPAAKVAIPAGLREQFPALVESILRSPQLDEKQIRYWFSRLPDMTNEQRANLVDSLRKQWWIIPGEQGRTPQAYVDGVRLHNGGFGPG